MKPDPAALCKAIDGEKHGDSCSIAKDNEVFAHCKAIGGNVQGEKCLIPDKKLEKMT